MSRTPPPDRGIFATWYDLADDDRARFQDWLHRSCLPALAADPRHLWVAHYENQAGKVQTVRFGSTHADVDTREIPAGNQYLLLVGAASPHTFLTPLVLDKALPGDPAMAALMRHARHAIFVEEDRVDGPAAQEAPLPAPAIRFGTFNMKTPAGDFDAGRWYAQSRLPAMGRAPGCVRSRKLACIAGWPRHGILYEFASPEMRTVCWASLKEERARNPEAFWTIGPDTLHAPGSPTMGVRTWPPT